jgi:hypothetical protein
MKHTIGIIVSAFAIVAAGCGDRSMRPTEPEPVSSFTGVWIGASLVISCEHPSGGCVNYPVGQERYLNFRLTQTGDDVTGNLSPVKGGPLVLPPVFLITGRAESGKLAFQSLEVPGVSSGLTSYSGEVTLASPATQLVGRMTERTTNHLGEPITILWAVKTARWAGL